MLVGENRGGGGGGGGGYFKRGESQDWTRTPKLDWRSLASMATTSSTVTGSASHRRMVVIMSAYSPCRRSRIRGCLLRRL